jgi:hypothetical protein
MLDGQYVQPVPAHVHHLLRARALGVGRRDPFPGEGSSVLVGKDFGAGESCSFMQIWQQNVPAAAHGGVDILVGERTRGGA